MKRGFPALLCLSLLAFLPFDLIAQPPKSPLASEISQELRNIYAQSVSNKEPSLTDVDQLRESLIKLEALDKEIQLLGPGILDAQLKELKTTYRALGWLHGWAAFSQLAIISSKPGADVWRQKLLNLDPAAPPSVLGLLLTIYKEMVSTEQNNFEPLQKCLFDLKGRGYALDLAYRWPVPVGDDFYIPPSADILGKPSDSKIGQRGFLSLWALVNLQLDTWPEVVRDPLTIPPNYNEVEKETLGLTPIINWLDKLRENPALKLFASGTSFDRRIDCIARFLKFREVYSLEPNLNTLIENLHKERGLKNGEIKDALPTDLLIATAPDENGERLYDAFIWLRYVVLLSYQKAHFLALDERNNSNLFSTWERLGVKTWPSLDEREDGAFLRWNQWPRKGHVSAVIADLSVAAESHLVSEQHFRKMEELRLRGALDAPELKTRNGTAFDDQNLRKYENELGREITSLQDTFNKVLKKYFEVTPIITNQVDPAKLIDRTGPMNLALRTSGTPAEVRRIVGDVSFAGSTFQATQRRYQAILEAYAFSRQSPPQVTAMAVALRSMIGITPISKWDPYTLPQRSFDHYKANLDSAILSLQQKASEVDAANRLRQSFRAKKQAVEKSQYELLAAQLGKEVADNAVAISKMFTRIANLDIEIASLSTRIDELKLQAGNNQAAANNQKLVLMTQLRDLAAAKVQAVTEASEQAGKLAEQASKQLDTLKIQFQETAQKIEDQEKREHAFGIVKAIVSVVGAALAPFTGGASLTIATLANMAIDIGKKIDETNWKDFGSALQAATEIGTTLTQGVNLTVNNFGSDTAKAKLKDVNLWIKSTRDDVQKKLTDLGLDLNKDVDVKKVIEGMKTLGSGNPSDMFNFAAAVANGYTLNVGNNQIHVDFKGQKIGIKNDELQKELNNILNQGRIILNDAGQRAQNDIEKLVELPDEELKRKLTAAFRNAVTALPPELLDKLKVQESEAKQKVEDSLANIQKLIENQLSPDDRRSLAQALAAGLLFVKEGETVVLLKRPIDEEAKRFQARLDNFQKKVATDILGKFVKDIENRNKELMDRGQKLASEKNITALRSLASTDIPGQVNQLKSDVKGIKLQIDEAKGELEDSESKVKIADYEAKAAQLLVQAEELSLKRSQTEALKAQMQSDVAKMIYENSLKIVEQNAALVNAGMIDWRMKEEALLQVYAKCLAYGFNPLTVEKNDPVTEKETLEVHLTTPFQVLLSGFDGSSDFVDRHQWLDTVAEPLIGMIQWYRLLDIRDSRIQDPVAELISIVTSGKPLYEESSSETIASKIKKLGDNLYQAINTKAEATVDLLRVDSLNTSQNDRKFIWLGQEFSLSERNWELRDVEPTIAKQVVGLFYVRFGSSPVEPRDQRDYTTYKVAPSISAASDQKATEASFFADISSISLRITAPKGPLASQGLSFLVIAPFNSFPHPARPLVGEANRSSRIVDISTSPDDATLKDGLESKLGSWSKQLGLVGAFGEWKVLILANGVQTPEQRLAVIRELQETGLVIQAFRIGYFAVPFRK